MRKLFFITIIVNTVSVLAQNQVSNIILSTGFKANSSDNIRTAPQFNLIDDQFLYIDYFIKNSGVFLDEGRRLVIDKDSFALISNDKFYDASNPKFYNDSLRGPARQINYYLKDVKDSTRTIFNVFFIDSNRVGNFEFYSIDSNFEKDSLLFTYRDSSVTLLWKPLLYDSTIYLSLANLTFDTTFIKAIDFNGNLLNSNSFFNDSTHSFSSKFPNFKRYRGPTTIFPLNDSFLVYEYTLANPRIRLVNRFTLDTAALISIPFADEVNLLNTKGWTDYYGEKYKFYPNFFRVGSTLIYFTNLSQNFDADFNFYYIDIDYEGNVLRSQFFGNKSINERSFTFDVMNGIHYVAGSQPLNNLSPFAAEKREVLVYSDSANLVDSIFLFGNKNHIVLDMFVDSSENIYLLSDFSNAWSDDSVFLQLTKISKRLLTSIKSINQKQTSLVVYPNPTTDFIQSQQFKFGMKYQIYKISGQLVASSTIGNDKKISVQNFQKGSYLLVVFNGETQGHRSFHFIKQ